MNGAAAVPPSSIEKTKHQQRDDDREHPPFPTGPKEVPQIAEDARGSSICNGSLEGARILVPHLFSQSSLTALARKFALADRSSGKTRLRDSHFPYSRVGSAYDSSPCPALRGSNRRSRGASTGPGNRLRNRVHEIETVFVHPAQHFVQCVRRFVRMVILVLEPGFALCRPRRCFRKCGSSHGLVTSGQANDRTPAACNLRL